MREADYIRAVDAKLRTDNADLRARLLHQNIRYVSLLPFDGDWLTPPERCERLARMLTFHLGERSFCARQPELSRAFQWLYGILLYLETQCPPSDRTFQGILKLARLGQDVRENLQPLSGEYFQFSFLENSKHIRCPYTVCTTHRKFLLLGVSQTLHSVLTIIII